MGIPTLEMDNVGIFTILKMEHDQAKAGLNQLLFETAERMDVFADLRDILVLHMFGEETVVYRRLLAIDEIRPMALASRLEHDLIREVLEQIPSSYKKDVWIAKIRVLSDLVNKHIDVEEKEIFPKARVFLSIQEQLEFARDYQENTS